MKIYAVTDRMGKELKEKGCSCAMVAFRAAEELKRMGYVPRKDIYAVCTISLIREFRRMIQRNALDAWVRFFLDV